MQAYLQGCRLDYVDLFTKLCAEQRNRLLLRSLSEEANSDFRYGFQLNQANSRWAIEALVVVPYGRFGNIIIQVTHAIDVARHLNIRQIIVDLGSQQPGVFAEDEYCYIEDFSILMSYQMPSSLPPSLVGRFWSLSELIAPTAIFKRDVASSQSLYALLSSEVKNKARSKNFDRAVHIRAGDVFTENNINSHYVQPPLSFYQKAILESDLPICGSTAVVFEDRSNPTVEALAKWLDQQGVSYENYSGSLKDDLSILLSAREIIASFGTFIPAVMKLSEKIKRICFFDNHYARQDQVRFRPDVVSLEYVDLDGQYIKAGEWTASAEQLRQILDYPARCIGRKQEMAI